MALEAVMECEAIKPSRCLRRSPRESVRGSNAMGSTGGNGTACLTSIPTGRLRPKCPIPIMATRRHKEMMTRRAG